MFYDHRFARALMDMRMKQAQGGAKIRQVYEAGFKGPGRWPRRGHRLLGGFGGLLVTLGHRLQRYHLPQPLSLEGEIINFKRL